MTPITVTILGGGIGMTKAVINGKLLRVDCLIEGESRDLGIIAHVGSGQTPPTTATLSLQTNLVFLFGHPGCSNLPLNRECKVEPINGVGPLSVATHGGTGGGVPFVSRPIRGPSRATGRSR